jgi:hypothetical protein
MMDERMDDLSGMEEVLVPVTLESGRRAAISVTSFGGEEQVASRVLDFSSVLVDVREMCGAVVEAVDKLPGKKVSIEFGLAFGIESGQLVTMFAKASVNASLKVSIEISD